MGNKTDVRVKKSNYDVFHSYDGGVIEEYIYVYLGT